MLPPMLIVGLTGGIGSGKSTVSSIFSSLGVTILDTDQVAHDLVEVGQPALIEIAKAFGNEVLTPDGALDRAKLRDIVFEDSQQRATLESILHPRIKQEILNRIRELYAHYCIVVVPLLVEKRWTDIVDMVLVIDVADDMQKLRVGERDGLNSQQIEAILSAQASREERLAVADNVIVNDGDMQQLKAQVEKLHKKFLKLAKNEQIQ